MVLSVLVLVETGHHYNKLFERHLAIAMLVDLADDLVESLAAQGCLTAR